jgi:hypothetical protein
VSTPSPDSTAKARAVLADAYTEMVAASKVAVGDDGQTLLGAAAAIDLAVEFLTPPAAEVALAAGSCREALALVSNTRSYAPGGNIANLLDPARKKLDDALRLLAA